MDRREEGKQRAVQFVTEVARGLKPEVSVSTLLWWPPDRPDDGKLPLRLYKGNSWRSIEFAESDIDASSDDPEVLKKYASEIAQVLAEL